MAHPYVFIGSISLVLSLITAIIGVPTKEKDPRKKANSPATRTTLILLASITAFCFLGAVFSGRSDDMLSTIIKAASIACFVFAPHVVIRIIRTLRERSARKKGLRPIIQTP